VLHVGSNRPEARLPTAKAVEIGRQVCLTAGVALLLTGERHEASLVEGLCAQIGPEARSLAGCTDLLELAAVLEGAQVVVTTDSGPMHMAAAVGTPTVALFGPGDPQRFGPRGSPGQVAILQSRTRSHDSRHWHMELTARAVVETMRGLARGRRARADSP
jgi:ADP-heptose:LPS heptosyltransferase